MRTLLLQFIAGSLLFLTACQKKADAPAAESRPSVKNPLSVKTPDDDVIATFQSKGRDQRSAATNLPIFLEIAALPESHEVVTGLVGKVTTLLSQSNISSNLVATIGAEKLSSILEATIEFDSVGELRRSKGDPLTGTVALRTSDEQHAALTNRLSPASKDSSNSGVSAARKGNWTLLELGRTSKNTGSDNVEKLLARGESFVHSTNWLDVTINMQKLGSTWFSANGSTSNQLHFAIAPQNDTFRTEIHLTSERPFNFELGEWNVPTNTIRDPLIGFTAMQGVRRWIQEQSATSTIGLTNAPNQVFLWSQAISPFSVSVAASSEAPKQIVDGVVGKLLPRWKPVLAPLSVGKFEVWTNESIVKWLNLPVVIPFLRSAPAPETNFIFAGLFPVTDLGTKAPPPELIAQVASRTNLVYYDWEITSERMTQWRQISQVISIIKNEFSGDTNLLSERWLNGIQAKLGNCVTEGLLTNPRELAFVRRSAMGLNSLELVSLARWLDPAFTPKLREKKATEAAVPLAPTP